jgi:hypothetical protein
VSNRPNTGSQLIIVFALDEPSARSHRVATDPPGCQSHGTLRNQICRLP